MQAIELPYEGRKVSMVVVLPRGDFTAFETAFDGKALLGTLAGLSQEKLVRVSLPKFELTGDSISLRKPLEALGMSAPFSAKDADFRRWWPPRPTRFTSAT